MSADDDGEVEGGGQGSAQAAFARPTARPPPPLQRLLQLIGLDELPSSKEEFDAALKTLEDYGGDGLVDFSRVARKLSISRSARPYRMLQNVSFVTHYWLRRRRGPQAARYFSLPRH